MIAFKDYYINKIIDDLNAQINQRRADKVVQNWQRNERAKKRKGGQTVAVMSGQRVSYHEHLIPVIILSFVNLAISTGQCPG